VQYGMGGRVRVFVIPTWSVTMHMLRFFCFGRIGDWYGTYSYSYIYIYVYGIGMQHTGSSIPRGRFFFSLSRACVLQPRSRMCVPPSCAWQAGRGPPNESPIDQHVLRSGAVRCGHVRADLRVTCVVEPAGWVAPSFGSIASSLRQSKEIRSAH
jgi:hypothetical protein